MKLLSICNWLIKYSFYSLFLLVPLAFRSDTSELFELNKMWLVWGLTIIVATSWTIKMILQKKFIFQRTPLDIPIGLFLLSQIISSIFSLDPHTSIWGYYSRFNGGLLSIISYVFLYYAFLSNFQENAMAMVKRSLLLSLVSGLIVALWGLPSHFGYDPTCLLFRGKFDVSCWTDQFQPKLRIFSTLGQPDWLAAYLAILIPITTAFFINNLKSNSSEIDKKYHVSSIMYHAPKKSLLHATYYLLLTTLFYVDLLYTGARSGFVGIWGSLIFFVILYWWLNGKPKISILTGKLKSPFAVLAIVMLIATFIIGTPIGQLNKFITLEGVGSYFKKIQTAKTPVTTTAPTPPSQSGGGGGTESGSIRLLVWEGAIAAWKDNPIFGTGVETFAFAYYKYKPAGQNLTSEWDFLYNKAHNEYLNYLATTGLFGLGTYLLMIVWFLVLCIKYFVSSIKKEIHNTEYLILNTGLLAAYVSILITDFFGFSVVITNVYLFMIPAFVFVLTQQVKVETAPIQANKAAKIETGASVWQWTPIFFILITGGWLLFSLIQFWRADIEYGLGKNLDSAREYKQAYSSLHKAVQLRSNEPVFKDELALNDALVVTELISQNATASAQVINVASSLAQEAINTSNEVISQYQNSADFWKGRTRLFFALSQVDSRYLPRALDAIEKASLLAPNDAKIWYNLGVLYGQNGDVQKAISVMEKVVLIKPDYREAHYALGLFYRTKSLDKSAKIVEDQALNQKAIDQMQYILDHISPNDADALKSIAEWTK